MLRSGAITAYILTALLLLTGCPAKDKTEPPITDIRLGDLAPINPTVPARSVQTVAFDFYGLRLPAENITVLSDIWLTLYTKPLRLADPDAFAANSFKLVFGEAQMWQKTATLLESAGARAAGNVRLILDYGQADDVAISQTDEKTSISYLTANLTIESLAAQGGQLVLKVKVAPVAGARGVCDFSAIPVFIPVGPKASDENSAAAEDISFDALGFSVQMGPGDFLLMGPLRYPSTANSLGGLFFTTAQERTICLYAIFCSGITD